MNELLPGWRRGRDADPAGRTAESDAVAIDIERERWYEFIGLVRVLRPQECMEPGYYGDPAWSVRDLMGHIGTWLAEAEVQLERLNAGTYEGHTVDVDALNQRCLRAPDPEATWWLRKSGADHYDEHLRAWVDELVARR